MRTLVMLMALSPAVVRAQQIPPACQPLVDAERKEIVTPHHMYVVRAGATSELISTGGVTYIQVHGAWRRSPMSPTFALAQLQENLDSATAFSCRHAGAESVAGVPTIVYTAHVENQGVKADTRTWVATATGLPLKQEEDMEIDGTPGTTHQSTRWDYTNVRAPEGAP